MNNAQQKHKPNKLQDTARPNTEVEYALTRLEHACCYRKPTIMDRIQRITNSPKLTRVQQSADKAVVDKAARGEFNFPLQPKLSVGLVRTDNKPIRGNQDWKENEVFLKGLQLPKCKEAEDLLKEDELRVKILESSGIYECNACAGSGHVYESLSKFVETGGAKVKCSDCAGSGEQRAEKQGFDTFFPDSPHSDAVDALAYALNPLQKLVYAPS